MFDLAKQQCRQLLFFFDFVKVKLLNLWFVDIASQLLVNYITSGVY